MGRSAIGLIVAIVLVGSWLYDSGLLDLPGVFAGSSSGSRVECTVTRVVDGDTVIVDDCETPGRVRLLLIDTPEVHGGNECFGPEASAFAVRWLEGQQVTLEADEEHTDIYDRMLRYVWLDDELFNERIVREGFGTLAVYRPNVKYRDRIERAEAEARDSERGLWAECAN